MAKLYKPLTHAHYHNLDLLLELVHDTYMLESIRLQCGLSHPDLDRLVKALKIYGESHNSHMGKGKD